MQTYDVIFHDWHGTAIRAEGHWWLAPRQVSDHLGLSWRRQLRKFREGTLAKGVALRGVPSAGGTQETLTLKTGHFGHWLLGIAPLNVPEPKRERLIAMQESLLDAIERQLERMFGLPGLVEAEDFERLPLPPVVLSQMAPEECRTARAAVLHDPEGFAAARLLRLGLPATRVAPVVGRSVYWTRNQARQCRRLGLVPLPAAQQRLLDQPSLFADA